MIDGVDHDLSTLDRMGVVRRVHGGAVPAGSLTVIESGIVERDQSNTQAKEAIATAALSLLPSPDSVVVIDAGSTTSRFAAQLNVQIGEEFVPLDEYQAGVGGGAFVSELWGEPCPECFMKRSMNGTCTCD